MHARHSECHARGGLRRVDRSFAPRRPVGQRDEGPRHGKVDGLFYTVLEHEGTRYAHYGLITQLERGKVVQHTWVSQGTKGLESLVTTTFAPRDGGTFVTVRHTGVPDDEEGRMHVMGWNFVLGSLAEHLTKR